VEVFQTQLALREKSPVHRERPETDDFFRRIPFEISGLL